jgi:hypothetical protein
MDVEYGDRGEVIGIQLSIQDVKDRKLLYKPDRRIHPMLRDEVQRHREAYLESLRRQEMQQRFPDGRPKGTSEFWRQIEARQPAISEWLHAGEPGQGELSEG